MITAGYSFHFAPVRQTAIRFVAVRIGLVFTTGIDTIETPVTYGTAPSTPDASGGYGRGYQIPESCATLAIHVQGCTEIDSRRHKKSLVQLHQRHRIIGAVEGRATDLTV